MWSPEVVATVWPYTSEAALRAVGVSAETLRRAREVRTLGHDIEALYQRYGVDITSGIVFAARGLLNSME